MLADIYLNPLPQIENASWIPLTHGYYALVDTFLLPEIQKTYKFYTLASKRSKTLYARHHTIREDGKRVTQDMHRWIFKILGIDAPNQIDHINQNGLDNRLSNLRAVTGSQNCGNESIRSSNTSGYRGVSWHKQHERYTASICINGKLKYLGIFDSKEEGAKAYDLAAIEYFGIEYAYTNFPKSDY